ncbi:MAG TPA: CDP-alcohol phosphatidyltransferase family protein [Gemmatimonadaceae bacterium]|nr:CDP-alcohol phosphatidyltransferase family protein [Gemmatimonadaceae bacterium]
MGERSRLNLPNLLSLSRVALAMAFPFARDPVPQAALIVAAGASDFLDGWLARARHTASKWGALLDPITDRIFVVVAIATYVAVGALTVGQLVIMLIRDIMTAVGFVVARFVPSLQRVTFRARWLGKIVTTVQLIVLLAIPLAPVIVRPLVIVVGVLSVAAVIDYTIALWRARARA